jgi:hypothetical protein
MYDTSYTPVDFASDDWCDMPEFLVEYGEASDPGASFGPNRIWLEYDDDVALWSIMGAWDTPIYTVQTGGDYIVNPQLHGTPDALPPTWFVWNNGSIGIDADHDGTGPIPAASGELFRFLWNRPYAPCLDQAVTWWATGDNRTGQIAHPQLLSPDWCVGSD